MNLLEFKNRIDFLVKSTPYPQDKQVVIDVKTTEATLGSRPFSKVKDIHIGFDWEYNQARISTEDILYKRGK